MEEGSGRRKGKRHSRSHLDAKSYYNDEQELLPRTERGSKWVLKDKKFLWESRTVITSSAFNKSTNVLVVGVSNGTFGLYEMPGCVW